ncbi:MAG TPA: PIN domain-containing protein [Kiritimatiellia bacterium]|nr:PIN domain-containing protein [Kiritimatiellia bacterium]
MICLDTNYLINGLSADTPEEELLIQWHTEGEVLCTPAICWYEFLSGPVTDAQTKTIKAFLRGGILPFGETEAMKSAELFNATHRLRRLRIDTMIAATAIAAKARLASNNLADFEPFVPFGLELL